MPGPTFSFIDIRSIQVSVVCAQLIVRHDGLRAAEVQAVHDGRRVEGTEDGGNRFDVSVYKENINEFYKILQCSPSFYE